MSIHFESKLPEGSDMSNSADRSLDHFSKVFILWGSGWKRRKWKTNGKAFSQWRDPHSGLWYGKKAAMKILEAQALDQLNLK